MSNVITIPPQHPQLQFPPEIAARLTAADGQRIGSTIARAERDNDLDTLCEYGELRGDARVLVRRLGIDRAAYEMELPVDFLRAYTAAAGLAAHAR